MASNRASTGRNLTDATLATYHFCQGREVSPEDVRGLLRWCAAGTPSIEQVDLRDLLKHRAVEAYTRIDPADRVCRQPVILAYIYCGVCADAARVTGVPKRTAERWIERFLQFAADYCNYMVKFQARNHHEERRDRDALRSWCEMTHAQSGGDGRTPNVDAAKVRAKTCPACSILSAGAPDTGWADQEWVEQQRAKLRRGAG